MRTLVVAAALVAMCAGCKRSQKKQAPDASLASSASAGPSAVPIASFLARVLDAGPPRPDAGVVPAVIDAGPLACKPLQGPYQMPFTGPAALLAREGNVEVVVHKNGVAKTTVVPVDPPAAKPTRRELPPGVAADRASKPACVLAGPYAFCSDASGDIHRQEHAPGAPTADTIVAKGDPGARITAAEIGGSHVVVGYMDVRHTTEGRLSEAFAKVDDTPPMKISESGSGATDLAFVERGVDVLAVMVDARRAMSPMHARILSYRNGLVASQDAVAYVGGGADHQVFTAISTSHAAAAAYALMPITTEEGFGMVAVRLDEPPKMDEPSVTSLYLNGIDAAPIAATHGATGAYVARVRPAAKEVGAMRVLEIGKLDDHGAFTTFGVVPTSGSVVNVALEADPKVAGALWLYYTDGAGSWLERRACP